MKAGTRIHVETLPNGESLVSKYSSAGELVGSAIVAARRTPGVTLCANCSAELGRGDNCFGIDGATYCEPCGQHRLDARRHFRLWDLLRRWATLGR